MSDADFTPLGNMEFDSVPAVYEFAQAGRTIAASSGLIVVQAAHDLKRACLTIPVMDGRPNGKANRVTRPLRRAAMHMWAIQRCFAITPKVFLSVYGEEIAAVRTKHHKTIDLGKK